MSREETKDKNKNKNKRTGLILFIIVAAIISGLIVLTIYSMNKQTGVVTDLPQYSGEYSIELRNIAEKYLEQNDPVFNETIKYLFTKYYLKLYNTSLVWNKTFQVKINSSIIYVVKVTRNETLIVDTHGNGTYSYVFSLDPNGKYLIEGSGSLGNSSREFKLSLPPQFFHRAYIDLYVIVSSNSSRIVEGYISIAKKPPDDIGVILTRAGIEYVTLLLNSWMKTNFNITDKSLKDIIDNTRDPAVILRNNITEINSFEASLILKKIYDILKIDSHIIAVDTDGDEEPDHFAVVIKPPNNDPAFFSDQLMNILEGINRVGEIPGGEIHVKYVPYNNINWVIIDPIYQPEYVPGQLLITSYNVLGAII